jgi:hypothetical protein
MTDTLFILKYLAKHYPDTHPLLMNFRAGQTKSYKNAIYTMVKETLVVFEGVYTPTFLIRVATTYINEKRSKYDSIA